MKKYFFILSIGLMSLSSCEEACDTSTVEGAADCACYLYDQQTLDLTKDDKSLSDDIKSGLKQWEAEVEKHIEAGDYTEKELKTVLKERNCMF